MNHRDLYVLGDTHGNWNTLFYNLKNYGIQDCDIIHVGDVGIGFLPKDEEENLLKINSYLAGKNIKMFCIRGNHDDPKYFLGNHQYSNLILLSDYSTRIFNDKKFLFVGGAVSVDRIYRTWNKDWWENEGLVLDESKIEICDVLITHTAPSWNGPNDGKGIKSFIEKDDSLWEECQEERAKIDKLIQLSEPIKHFCGHFHTSSFTSYNACDSRILDIMEIKRLDF
jgi:hypothetical protein